MKTLKKNTRKKIIVYIFKCILSYKIFTASAHLTHYAIISKNQQENIHTIVGLRTSFASLVVKAFLFVNDLSPFCL